MIRLKHQFIKFCEYTGEDTAANFISVLTHYPLLLFTIFYYSLGVAALVRPIRTGGRDQASVLTPGVHPP